MREQAMQPAGDPEGRQQQVAEELQEMEQGQTVHPGQIQGGDRRRRRDAEHEGHVAELSGVAVPTRNGTVCDCGVCAGAGHVPSELPDLRRVRAQGYGTGSRAAGQGAGAGRDNSSSCPTAAGSRLAAKARPRPGLPGLTRPSTVASGGQ